MEISNSPASIDVSQLQRAASTQTSARPAEGRRPEGPPPPEQRDVEVSISGEARAAQELEAQRATETGATEGGNPVAQTRDAEGTRPRDEVTAALEQTATPAAPQRQENRITEQRQRAERGEPTGPTAPRREPDAASTAGNQAVQLYLANAVRPENRPPPAPVRASA